MLWLITTALAQVPPGITPSAAPPDIAEQYRDHQKSSGVAPPWDLLACDDLWLNQAELCFRLDDGNRRRFVTERDLRSWGVTLPQLREEMDRRAVEVLQRKPEKRQITGMSASYWMINDPSWAAAGLLQPATLAEQLGTSTLFVALPVDTVLLAWIPGDPEVDKVMAIAVRELHDGGDSNISAVVHKWANGRWSTFGEAKPRSPTP